MKATNAAALFVGTTIRRRYRVLTGSVAGSRERYHYQSDLNIVGSHVG
jgi:hypothetical protein